MKLVKNAKQAWRWVSVQAMLVAGAIQAAWIFIPAELQASIPQNIVQGVTLALLAFGVAGRLVDQAPKDKPER